MGRPFTGGSLTAKGYRRTWDAVQKRRRMVHDLVWERANGLIPSGMEVHHKDHDRQNNLLANLELVNRITHKRIHGNCELRNGVWWKPCRQCKVMKSVDIDYYPHNGGKWIQPICKKCQIENSIKNKQARKLAAAAI
jgi:hypothetical protein